MRPLALGLLVGLMPAICGAYVGSPVDASRFPSTVYIELDRGTGGTQRCTAAVIGPRAVLTASHCLGQFVKGDWTCILQDLQVGVGAANRRPVTHRLRLAAVHPSVLNEEKAWWNIWPGPQYEGLSDVAVLVFNEDLGLPAALLADSVTAGERILIGGYGQSFIDQVGYSSELRMGQKNVADLRAAQFSARSNDRSGFVLHGDSGGPAYDLSGRIVGVNSFIRPDESERVAGPGGRDYNRVVSFTSNLSRTDILRSWVASAEQGRAGAVRCPFKREER